LKPTVSVAYIGTKGIPARYGGFETLVQELATRLGQIGVKCVVYGTSDPAEVRGVWENVIARRVPQVGSPGVDRLLREFWPIIDQLVHPAEVVHIMAGSLSCLLWRILGFRTVVSLDGKEWMRGSYGRITRILVKIGYVMAARFADEVTVDNRLMSLWLEERFQRTSTLVAYGPRSYSMPMEGETESFLRQNGLSPKRYFLFVGRLVPEKGVEMMISAFADIPDQQLAVVGSDPFGGKYECRLREMAQDNVIFIGPLYGRGYELINMGAIAQIRPAIDESEGTSPAIIEAMGFGLPIVASDVSQNREALGTAAVYYNHQSQDELVRAIRTLLQNPNQMETIANEGRTRAMTAFSWSTWVTEVKRIYDSLTQREE
jgi:glycosyltransferase involved in cell wall biosynthesis